MCRIIKKSTLESGREALQGKCVASKSNNRHWWDIPLTVSARASIDNNCFSGVKSNVILIVLTTVFAIDVSMAVLFEFLGKPAQGFRRKCRIEGIGNKQNWTVIQVRTWNTQVPFNTWSIFYCVQVPTASPYWILARFRNTRWIAWQAVSIMHDYLLKVFNKAVCYFFNDVTLWNCLWIFYNESEY